MNVTLPDGRVLTLPRLKFGVMGRPGGGKSRLIASMPKPLIVMAGDPEEKLSPYFDVCGEITETVGQFGQRLWIGHSPKTGKPIIQIEQFYDTDPKNAQAITGLIARCEQLGAEVLAGMWASAGFDSYTQFERYAIWRRTHGPFRVKDADAFGRAHGAAKDDMVAMINAQIMPLKCNVGIAFHTTEKPKDEGGVSYFGIKAVGQSATDIASLLPERYRAEALPDGTRRQLWTRPDGRYDLCTLIDAPSPCENTYQALWTNWIAKRAAAGTPAAAQPAPDAPPSEKE